MVSLKQRQAIQIATINVNRLNIAKKRAHVFQTLHNLPYSIIALQETHGNKDAIKIWEKEWPGKSIWCPTTCSHSCGVAFLFNKRFNASILHHKCDADGRALGVHVKIQNSNFHLKTKLFLEV